MGPHRGLNEVNDMSLRSVVFLLLFASFTAVAGGSDFIGSDLLIPVAGRTDGAYGSRWRTDVLVTNTSRLPSVETVEIVFRRGGEPDQVFRSAIGPRATLVLNDAVRNTFGHENAIGTIRVIAGSGNAALSARARIYNVASQSGQFGQIVPGLAIARLPREAYLPGLRGLEPNRTNVGIVNAGSENALVILTLWDREGRMLRGIFEEIPPSGSLALNDVFTRMGTGPLDDVTLHVVASQPVYAWASVVRSDSGDSDFITASGAER